MLYVNLEVLMYHQLSQSVLSSFDPISPSAAQIPPGCSLALALFADYFVAAGDEMI
jgi:hypothetical protein